MADRKRRSEDLTYQITDPDQLRAVVSTVRSDIMDQVAAFGPLSVREIGELTGAAPSSLYHHVQQLLAVGLLTPAGERHAAKKPEQLYDTPAPRMRMLEALQDPANHEVLRTFVGWQRSKEYEPLSLGIVAPVTLAPSVALLDATTPARTDAWRHEVGPGSRIERILDGTEATGPLGPVPQPRRGLRHLGKIIGQKIGEEKLPRGRER